MEIVDSIYEGGVEHYYKKTTRSYANRAGHMREIRGETASSKNFSEMIESAVNHRKRHVDHTEDRSRQTCLIHVPGNSLY